MERRVATAHGVGLEAEAARHVADEVRVPVREEPDGQDPEPYPQRVHPKHPRLRPVVDARLVAREEVLHPSHRPGAPGDGLQGVHVLRRRLARGRLQRSGGRVQTSVRRR